MTQAFYDPTKPYEENYDEGPFGEFAGVPPQLPKGAPSTFLDFRVDIPFGIPAGPLLNSKFVSAAWRWGFSIATYKTVRPDTYPCHPFPNVIKVDTSQDVHPGDTVKGNLDMNSVDVMHDGITNSFGVPSKPAAVWQQDVREALAHMSHGNLLILSFMGTKKDEMTRDEYIANFAHTCRLAKETGAPVLEVNFSCPNVGKEGLICNDVETSRAILEAMKPVKGNTPLLVKIGYFAKEQHKDLHKLLDAIHECADGVVAINTVQAKVIDEAGQQILPGSPVRLFSGVCGATIRWAGLEMVRAILAYKKQNGWNDLAVVGVGGVATVADYQRYRSFGTDAVQSATGAMWRSGLAIEVRQSIAHKESTS